MPSLRAAARETIDHAAGLGRAAVVDAHDDALPFFVLVTFTRVPNGKRLDARR